MSLPSLAHLRPPWTAVGKQIESAVRRALFDFQLLDQTKKICVALSGGKDSISLLLFLKAILGRGFPKIPLAAAHVSGEFSCGAGVTEGYLRALCDQIEVPLCIKQSTHTLDQLECYSCSRERRMLLFQACHEVGADAIAFGHHRDDQIQTLLLNLFHKGEFAGLLPDLMMEHYGIKIMRPLIYVSEADIRVFAQKQGFARITCRCPVGQHSKRRQVEELIQEIEQKFPHVRGNLAHAAFQYGSEKARTP